MTSPQLEREARRLGMKSHIQQRFASELARLRKLNEDENLQMTDWQVEMLAASNVWERNP